MTDPDPPRACFNVLRGIPRTSPPDLDPELLSTQLPRAAVLLVIPDCEGLLLVRLARDGSSGGDTWHADWDEVQEEVDDYFGDVIGEWHEIPAGTSDVEAYVLSQL